MNKAILPLLALLTLVFSQCAKSFNLPYGKEMRVTQLLGQTVPNTVGIGFKFDEAEKKIMGNAGCNNFSAPFTLKGSKLSFGNGVSTKKYCQNQEWEDKFFQMLSQVKGVKQEGSKLLLKGDGGKTVAALSE